MQYSISFPGARPAISMVVFARLFLMFGIGLMTAGNQTLAQNEAPNVIINEINFRSETDLEDEDWVELYNASSASIDVSGWILRDSKDRDGYTIPENTTIVAYGFLVLCRNSEMFSVHHPNVMTFLGDFTFGLSGDGDEVRIFDRNNRIVDAVSYNVTAPWPNAADTEGQTLELIDAQLNNGMAVNWRASRVFGGTPGSINSMFQDTSRYTLPRLSQVHPPWPNPTAESTMLSFATERSGQVQLLVYNAVGTRVATVEDAWLRQGTYSLSWNSSANAPGLYYVALYINGKPVASRLAAVVR